MNDFLRDIILDNLAMTRKYLKYNATLHLYPLSYVCTMYVYFRYKLYVSDNMSGHMNIHSLLILYSKRYNNASVCNCMNGET